MATKKQATKAGSTKSTKSTTRSAPAAGKPLKGVTVPGVDLQRGAQGAAVKQLQRALVKARVMTQAQMNTGPGVFGPVTQASLKKFQRAHRVEAIGVYGPKTRAAFVRLGAKLAKAPKPPAGGHKNPFLPQFQRALAHLRLPKAWASSEALWQLIQHESSWNPHAKNPSSTAFGLFQFLKSTWATYIHEAPYGTADPYVQALGGFRYVKARYGTPQRAWAFWQRHHWW
jgi:peptidoglycan hydrolase-like protein with peptidoglycan-binding domain